MLKCCYAVFFVHAAGPCGLYCYNEMPVFIAAVSKANKTLKDPDEVKKIKHILEEAEATIQLKVCIEID